MGSEIVEPSKNKTIHQVDECVDLEELATLKAIYKQIYLKFTILRLFLSIIFCFDFVCSGFVNLVHIFFNWIILHKLTSTMHQSFQYWSN